LRGQRSLPDNTPNNMTDSNPRRDSGGSNSVATVFKLIDYLIVAMVVLPAIALACVFLPFLWGGMPVSGWLDDTRSLIATFSTYCAGLALCLCRWMICPLIRSSAAPIEAPALQRPPPRRNAPAYAWICHVCAASNPPGQDHCVACGHAANVSMAEVAAATAGATPPAKPLASASPFGDA
jgi:hypothetical protein